MRILQIIQKRQLRGAEIFACQLSVELKKLGHHVDVVYLFDAEGAALHFDLNFISLGAQAGKRFHDFAAYKRLALFIAEGDYDIVQANAGDTLKYAAFSKALHGWKSKLVFRNANMMSRFMRNTLHRFINRVLLKRCNYIVSVSENCRQDVIGLFPAAATISRAIPIGTYRFNEQPVERTNEGQEPVFMNMGSLVPEKNHAFLVDAFHAYVTKHQRGYLWIVGDGRLRAALEAQVRQLGVEKRVRFWGYQNSPVSILKAADVFVMPSRIEGLPGAILESLSCGVPVIAAAVGGVPEVIADDENGYCIKSYDVDVYVRCMESLVDNADLRKSFTDAGRALIERHYLMEKIASRFDECYAQLVNVK